MFAPELCLARLTVTSSDEAIGALAALLLARGHVTAGFAQAAIRREKRSPTGLPFEGCAVAIPHAEPENVVSPAIAVATLAMPVTFREMGSPATKLDVELIVMPALTEKQQAAAGLASLLEMLQDATLRDALLAATTGEELASLLTAKRAAT